MNFAISKALLVQWKEYKHLRLEALANTPEAFATSYEEALQTEDEAWMDRLTSNVYFFAWHGGALVGMAAAEVSQKEKVKHRAEIRDIYVSKLYRGNGIGKKLMEALIYELQHQYKVQKIVLYVTETQNTARRMYKKFGFREVGYLEKEVKVGEKFLKEYIMEKLMV